MATTRIIGIDPGFDRLGVCVLDKEGTKETLVYSSCITTSKSASFTERLAHVGDELIKVLTEYKPAHLAIEDLFFTKNQRTAMMVAEVRGVILFLAQKHGLRIYEYSPPAIKVAVTGYGKASKDDVKHMVSKIIRLPEKKQLDDEVDAIAIALTHSAHHKMTTWGQP